MAMDKKEYSMFVQLPPEEDGHTTFRGLKVSWQEFHMLSNLSFLYGLCETCRTYQAFVEKNCADTPQLQELKDEIKKIREQEYDWRHEIL